MSYIKKIKLPSSTTPYDIYDSTAARDAEVVHLTGNETISDTKTFTSSPIVPTPTTDYAAATKKYADDLIAGVADAMLFKGTLGTTADGATVTSLPASHKVGWTYKVVTAATYAGHVCEVGDMIACITTRTTANNADWTVYQANIDGAVTGPATSTDAHVAVFNGTTGKVVKDSGFTIASSVPANAKFTDTQLTETQIAAMGFTKNTGTYIKPSTGIPASDLASGVIPTVNNATLTIQRNGTTVKSFTANSATNVTANITVPTKTSELTNDSSYITSAGAPVQSVNGETGAVTLSASDVGALPDTTTALKNPNALTFTGATSVTYDGSAAKSVTIPTVPSSLKNPNALTFTGGSTASYDGSTAISVAIPTVPSSLKNPNALTFTGAVTVSYDGSAAKSVAIPKITLNGSTTTTPSFYAPTTVGTSGYVLTSNGSGAPSWKEASSGGTEIVVSSTQPSSQNVRDMWFKVVS